MEKQEEIIKNKAENFMIAQALPALVCIFIIILIDNLFVHFLICDALRDLVPFVQLKKREKHPQRSVNLNKAAG